MGGAVDWIANPLGASVGAGVKGVGDLTGSETLKEFGAGMSGPSGTFDAINKGLGDARRSEFLRSQVGKPGAPPTAPTPDDPAAQAAADEQRMRNGRASTYLSSPGAGSSLLSNSGNSGNFFTNRLGV